VTDNSLYIAFYDLSTSAVQYRRVLGNDATLFRYTMAAFRNKTMFYIATFGTNGTVGS
jgi:hypothetical protein